MNWCQVLHADDVGISKVDGFYNWDRITIPSVAVNVLLFDYTRLGCQVTSLFIEILFCKTNK